MSRWRRVVRWALAIALVGGLLTTVPGGAGQASITPPNFTEQVVFAGLQQPTNIEFAKDGRVFVAEKRGVIKVFPSVTSPTYTVFADLSAQVHGYWDRGLLGLALAPTFPTDPHVYVLYAYDAPPGQTAPYWNDSCSLDTCPVTGRLSRLVASGNVMTGGEQVLISDWCQQFPSHSIGDLHFGADGALYVSGGEGASFNVADYGQAGSAPNFCNDPPHSGALTPPTAEGGSLRAQDVRTAADPTGLSGAVLRLDPATGAAKPDNPLIASPDLNTRRIVGYGFRNPFRFAIRPGTSEVWVGDVGGGRHEEINRVVVGGPATTVPNFGWPCYEGPVRHSGFDPINLDLCESLYAGPGHTAPFFSWPHATAGPAGCPRGGGSAVGGVAFYPNGTDQAPMDLLTYPESYRGALFFADYTRRCIYVMRATTPTSLPSPSLLESFETDAASPVDLAIGPQGELYYVDISGGTIRRYVYTASGNHPPVAAFTVSVPDDSLTATFDASSSSDQDPEDQGQLAFAWDFGDGTGQGASGATSASHVYPAAGIYTATLTVTDTNGASSRQSIVVAPGKIAPVAVIDTPSASTRWQVGQTISFSGHATDADAPGGSTDLPASALRWNLRMQHCSTLGDCHTHYLREWSGTTGASFVAPDHEYPSYLELEMTAQDAEGLQTSVLRRLDPATVSITFVSSPPELPLTVGDYTGPAPFTRTFIKGSSQTVSAPAVLMVGQGLRQWRSWSDSGALSHVMQATANGTLTAQYDLATTENVAIGKAAKADWQCSPDEGAEKAVNGTVNGGPSDRWCSSGSYKWLQVDLGAARDIVAVAVRHAGAGGDDPLFNTRDFTVQISNDGTNWQTVATVTNNTDNSTVHPIRAVTRFVRLLITKPNGNNSVQARIYELEVLALRPKLPTGSSLPNLAAGKVTTADSQCGPDNGADKAVDGRWTGSWNAWCSAGASPWLRVDLGTSVAIGTVVIRHAGASGASELLNTRDFAVQVSANGTTWTTVANVVGNVRGVTTHEINTSGRFIRVLITDPTSGGDSIARIYELEVYPPTG